ncbi:MAG: hypothetical protein KJO34_09530 [Deltaproteobacteria bacterium]|nr:hypothetical protein [Deltaproteobacteria bacterium]
MNDKTIKKTSEEVVIDVAGTKLSDLWKKEDYWAIWLGTIILLVGLLIFLPRPPANMRTIIDKSGQVMQSESTRAPFKTIAWHKASAEKRKLRATNETYAKKLKAYLDAPYDWTANPVESLYLSPDKAKARSEALQPAHAVAKEKVDQALAVAQTAESAAADAGFKDSDLNTTAETLLMAFIMFYLVFPGITANI